MSANDANKAAVRRIYAALDRGDVLGVLAACEAGVEWAMCTAGGPMPKGHEAVAELYLALEEAGGYARFEVQDFFVDGDTVVAVGRAEADMGEGRERSERVHVWTLREGRAVRVRAYDRELEA